MDDKDNIDYKKNDIDIVILTVTKNQTITELLHVSKIIQTSALFFLSFELEETESKRPHI